MININVFSEEKAWSKRLRNKDLFFQRICNSFPKKYRFLNKKVSLTLLLSNNKNIQKLNKIFRKKNKVTDILSFPINKKVNNKIFYLGDIIISYEFMNKPKKINFIEFKEKVTKIFIHGFLHLMGYNHRKIKDFEKMNKEEIKLYNLVKNKI